MGDIEDFITYLYQNDLVESGIITCVIMLVLIITIEFLKDTLKLMDNLLIKLIICLPAYLNSSKQVSKI